MAEETKVVSNQYFQTEDFTGESTRKEIMPSLSAQKDAEQLKDVIPLDTEKESLRENKEKQSFSVFENFETLQVMNLKRKLFNPEAKNIP